MTDLILILSLWLWGAFREFSRETSQICRHLSTTQQGPQRANTHRNMSKQAAARETRQLKITTDTKIGWLFSMGRALFTLSSDRESCFCRYIKVETIVTLWTSFFLTRKDSYPLKNSTLTAGNLNRWAEWNTINQPLWKTQIYFTFKMRKEGSQAQVQNPALKPLMHLIMKWWINEAFAV